MEDIVNLIATDASAAQISDQIKDALFNKSAEKIEALKPSVANSFFGDQAAENTYVPDEQVSSEEEPTEQEE